MQLLIKIVERTGIYFLNGLQTLCGFRCATAFIIPRCGLIVASRF